MFYANNDARFLSMTHKRRSKQCFNCKNLNIVHLLICSSVLTITVRKQIPLKKLIEKLTVPQLVQKFPAFYATRECITAFVRAHHLPLSQARSTWSTPSNQIHLRSIWILSSYLRLRLPSGLFHLGFVILYACLLNHTCQMSRSSHSSWFGHSGNQIYELFMSQMSTCEALHLLLLKGRGTKFYCCQAPKKWLLVIMIKGRLQTR